jgi:hypothetical protein
MKLNREKCTLSVPSGKLLEYMVSHRIIDPNLDKILTTMNMNPPKSLHDVQKLTWCMAALSRFISKLVVEGLLFFKVLKKQDKFQWNKEAQEPNIPTHSRGSQAPQSFAALHICYEQCGQHDDCS